MVTVISARQPATKYKWNNIMSIAEIKYTTQSLLSIFNKQNFYGVNLAKVFYLTFLTTQTLCQIHVNDFNYTKSAVSF